MEQSIEKFNDIILSDGKSQKLTSEEDESFFELLTTSLINNYRALIDWEGNNAKDRECRTACEDKFYDRLTNDFLSNFSNFNSTKR